MDVALLTGGADRPYAYGLGTELISKGIVIDIIGSDELDCPEFHNKTGVNFLNLRGEQSPDASIGRKVLRVLLYYARLVRYVGRSERKIFHILWNNKFEYFDRVVLTYFYRFFGKKIVRTVHNVNVCKRDSQDSFLNRLTLRIQYTLADHLFVHSEKMKSDLVNDFGVHTGRITVIPFGINNSVPNTSLDRNEARRRLGIGSAKKVILFFGNIAPYKGLEYLVDAIRNSFRNHDDYVLIIAGRPKNCPDYWASVRKTINVDVKEGRIILKEEYIPDNETELYFKAADVLVLPYRYIYQSGVLFLGYSFGLPALVADVGSLREEIVPEKTGFVFKPEDPVDLSVTLEKYFQSDLFKDLKDRRQTIIDFANERHSWDKVGKLTIKVYAEILRPSTGDRVSTSETSEASLKAKVPS